MQITPPSIPSDLSDLNRVKNVACDSYFQMFGFQPYTSSRQVYSLARCFVGSTRIRRFFFPLLIFSVVSFLVVFLTTSLRYSSYYSVTFDPPQFLPCGMDTAVTLTEIRYDENEILRTFVRENTSLNKKLWKRIKPAMTTAEKQTLRFILRYFADVSDSQNFTYFLISGTLLGSYRHHGLMPWDDDVDILMRYAQRDEILRVFRNYSTSSDIHVETGNLARMKVFHKYRSVAVRGWRYRWPTIDISFYDENDTHVWERDGQKRYHVLPKTLVFPLHRRPFELLMMNSPRDAFAVLQLLYIDPTCVTLSWVHRTEKHPGSITRFNCKVVSPFYPFVHREVRGHCVEESLVLNGTVVYRIPVQEPIYAISKPYVLALEHNPTTEVHIETLSDSNVTVTTQSVAKHNGSSSSRT